ncbi:MAG: hypothetical protein Q9N34_01140 [Aquificota bacterium]|nr:hypothetical protein [Aquificota bacterium]
MDDLGYTLSSIENLAVGVFFLYEDLEDKILAEFVKRGYKGTRLEGRSR